ncbi:MAG: bifunctional riboflavin kinase/FAD synthetase [Pseudomonadota bacterium]
MILLRGSRHFPKLKNFTIATVGNFDGVHKGHQEIISFMVERAKQQSLKSVLITFEPTPKEFFAHESAPARISPLRQKFELIREMGVDYFACMHFNQPLSKIPAQDFVQKFLYEDLKISQLIVGDDFRFGHKRMGDISLLQSMGEQLGFEVTDQNTIHHEDSRISSSLVREKLFNGHFDEAAALLNRPFTISSKVFHGDKKGRTIGFPTANLLLKRRVSPVLGVFAVSAETDGKVWKGVANVGHRPTVNGQRKQLEVHLFDCEENLYGKRLTVYFHIKLRDEKKFSSFDELKEQISLDVNQAHHYFITEKK